MARVKKDRDGRIDPVDYQRIRTRRVRRTLYVVWLMVFFAISPVFPLFSKTEKDGTVVPDALTTAVFVLALWWVALGYSVGADMWRMVRKDWMWTAALLVYSWLLPAAVGAVLMMILPVVLVQVVAGLLCAAILVTATLRWWAHKDLPLDDD